jgi:hypothetical protein
VVQTAAVGTVAQIVAVGMVVQIADRGKEELWKH